MSDTIAIGVVTEAEVFYCSNGPSFCTRYTLEATDILKGASSSIVQFALMGGARGDSSTSSMGRMPELGDTLLALIAPVKDYGSRGPIGQRPYWIVGDSAWTPRQTYPLDEVLSAITSRLDAVSPGMLALSADLVVSGTFSEVVMAAPPHNFLQFGTATFTVDSVLVQHAGPEVDANDSLFIDIPPVGTGSAWAQAGGSSPAVTHLAGSPAIVFLQRVDSQWRIPATANAIWRATAADTSVVEVYLTRRRPETYVTDRLYSPALRNAIAQ